MKKLVASVAATALSCLGAAAVRAETPPPSIALYEMARHARDESMAARRPRTFWVRAVSKQVSAAVADTPLRIGAAGTVHVAFTVAHDGKLIGSRVTSSPGDGALDKAALAMLAKAAPFPPMPEGMPDASLSFEVPMRIHR